jgi:hypothetical protein
MTTLAQQCLSKSDINRYCGQFTSQHTMSVFTIVSIDDRKYLTDKQWKSVRKTVDDVAGYHGLVSYVDEDGSIMVEWPNTSHRYDYLPVDHPLSSEYCG